MKKIFRSFIVCFLFINLFLLNAYGSDTVGKSFDGFNGDKAETTQITTITKDDKVYVPIRELAKNFDMEVLWINQLNTVHLITEDYKEENIDELYTKGKSSEVVIKLDNRFLNFPKSSGEGQDVFIENGTTYVPLDKIAMALGKEIFIYEDTLELSIRDKDLETTGLPINEVTTLTVPLNEDSTVDIFIENGIVYYSDDYSVLIDDYNMKSMFYFEEIGVYFIDNNKNVYLQTLDNYFEPIEELSSIVDIYYSGNSPLFVGDDGYFSYNKESNSYDTMAYCPYPTKKIITEYAFEDIVMSFVGDIYLSDYVLNAYNSGGINNIVDPKIQSEFLDCDITMANQEFAFTNRGTKADDKQYTFRINPSYSKIFSEMNIDVVSLANNHALDFGVVGLEDSLETLNKIDVKYVGAGKNLNEAKEGKYFEVNDKKIGIIGATRVIPVYNWGATNTTTGMLSTYDPSIETVTNAISEAKTQSDFVVVYVHWGIEKAEKPEEYQRNLGKKYIDAGADLVIGSHPHVLQGIEYYNGKPIVYSLGNFMFYNSINRSAILKAYVDENNNVELQLLPSKANNSKIYLVEDINEKESFYRYMESISYGISFDKDGFIVK